MLNKTYHPEYQELYQITEPSTQVQMVSSRTRDSYVSNCNSSCPSKHHKHKNKQKKDKD